MTGYTELHDAIKSELTKESLTYSEVQTLEHSYQIDKLQEYLNKGMNLWDALVAYEEARGYKGADAEEEVIARCCEQFLAKTTFINSFASKHYKTARSISAFLTRMNADMQQLVADVNMRSVKAATTRNAEGMFETWNTDTSPEQDILNQVDALDDIARKWENAVKKVEQKRTAKERAKAESVKASTMDVDTFTKADVDVLHVMPTKSINDFTDAEIKSTEKWARKFYKELGTKSPFFRAWFGEWRTHDISSITFSTKDERKPFKAGKATNNDTGKVISWGDQVKNETIGKYGKGSNAALALDNIEGIVRNAVLLDTQVSNDKKKSKMPGSAYVHIFYAVVENKEGSGSLIRFTAEEAVGVKDGKSFTRAYELNEIKEVAELQGVFSPQSEGLTRAAATSVQSVADLYRIVKKYDKRFVSAKSVDQAVLNENGTPKVFYHGTYEQFEAFDASKGRSTMDIQGMFFSPSEIEAGGYGPNVGQYYVSLTNPASEAVGYAVLRRFKGQNEAGKKARQYLIDRGYDGVVNYDEIITFYPTQIKSATDNIGTFNKFDERYKYSTQDIETSDKQYMTLAQKVKDGTATDADKAELRKAVDATAKANGYVYGRAYHGTDYYKDITVFKRGKGGYLGSGIYFSDRQDVAQRYANRMGDGGKVYDAFLKIDNPLKVTSADPAQEILRAAYGNDRVYNERVRNQTNQSQLIQKKDITKLQSKGFDGIIWKLERGVETEYSVFDSKQIKSADLVTYDEDGNIIPLSERFNKENDDIRYSTQDKDFHLTQRIGEQRVFEMRGTTANVYGSSVELEGGSLLNRVRMMQNLAEMYGSVTVTATSEKEAQAFERAGAKRETDTFGDTEYGTWAFEHQEDQYRKDTQYDAKQKRKFADAVLKEVGTRKNFTKEDLRIIRARLEKAFAILHNAWHGQGDQLVAMEYADKLFDAILNRYTEMSEADAEMRDAILAEIPSRRDAKGHIIHDIEVTAAQMAEIKHVYGSVAAYNQALTKALGTRVYIKEAQNAQTLEDVFANNPYLDATTNEGDMPTVLLERAQETVGKRTNPYKADSEERAALKEAMFEKALTIVGIEKSTAQKVREAVKQARAEERAKAKDKTANAVAKVRAEERAKARKREAKLKEVTQKKIANLKVEQLRRDVKTIALKWNQRLVKMLANPTEASHIPVQLAREVAEFTDALTRFLDSGTERGQINLAKIAKAYQQAFDDQATIAQAKAENPKYDPRGQVIDREMYDEQLVQMMDELNEVLQGKTLKDLNPFEMRMLLNTVRGVAHTVYDANRMIGTSERKAIWKVGSTMVNELETAPKVSDKLRGYLETSLDLRRLARIYSGSNDNAEFVKLVNHLNEGAIEKERIAQTLQSILAPVTDQYGDEIRKWYGKNAEWIDTGITKNGKKVEITKGMRVSLAMHVLNEGNMRHIENGGLTIPNREMYRKGNLQDAYANGELVRLNAEQIEEIVSHMTEAEKAYVKAAKELFHKRTGYYVNKTSLQLLGYLKATVENYFPIHTDSNFTKTDFASLKMDGSIEGQGFLKERVNASNPVYLEDITSVVNRQIRGVALYAGLAVPMRNFNAVMNASIYEDDNGVWRPRTTVKKTLTQKMGAYGAKVVEGFLADVSEMSHVDVTPMERFAGKLATNYVKAVLLGNLKVALKQVASYPTAAAVIPWKYLAKGLTAGKTDIDLINQYTPLYQMRREGQANEISSIMAKRGLEQRLPWLLGWITKMDVATVGRIWKAAEYMVADQQKNLPVGSDAYYQAVAQVFNDTVQQTQPNFTPLQRNAALRSKNPIVRSLVLFGTQRMQNGGILMEAAYELRQSKGKSKIEIQAATQKLGRAVASQIVQNILLIAASIGVDALRGRMKSWQDDDKEITVESLAKGMGDMFLSNMVGSFLGGSEVYNLVSALFKKATGGTAYDSEFTIPALDSAETILNFVQDLPDVIKYLTGDHTDAEKLNKAKNWSLTLAKAFGYATGIPLENAVKDLFKGIIPAIQDLLDWKKTGELNPWLHQSGKLDSKKTAANYKEWTNAGKKGSTYLYWEKKLKDVQGGYKPKSEELFRDSTLSTEDKATLLRMLSSGEYTSEGAVVYSANGDVVVDFTNIDTYRVSTELSASRYQGFKNTVAMGVPEDVAATAFMHYADMKKQGEGANDRFRDWLFKLVSDPHQRAVIDMNVVGNAETVEGTMGYKADGKIYADYTTKELFDSYTKGKKSDKAETVQNADMSVTDKAKAFASMYDGYTAKGGIVYDKNGKVAADFTSDEAYRASQLGTSKYGMYQKAVNLGASPNDAITAIEKYAEIDKANSGGEGAIFREWLFKTYMNPTTRAYMDAAVSGKEVTVRDGKTYDEDGNLYRDYSSDTWYELSAMSAKRYQAAKELESTGIKPETTVKYYTELKQYSKKTEWTSYLKDKGLTQEQINIILWSRGWYKRK